MVLNLNLVLMYDYYHTCILPIFKWINARLWFFPFNNYNCKIVNAHDYYPKAMMFLKLNFFQHLGCLRRHSICSVWWTASRRSKAPGGKAAQSQTPSRRCCKSLWFRWWPGQEAMCRWRKLTSSLTRFCIFYFLFYVNCVIFLDRQEHENRKAPPSARELLGRATV